MALPRVMPDLVVGDVTIAALVEWDGLRRAPHRLLACEEEEARAALAGCSGAFVDASGDLVIVYQSFLLRTPHHRILVDTCTGAHKGLPAPLDDPGTVWLDRLHALGLDVADVDYVLCTHMHFDHTGWNTRLVDGRWVPTFPNARYIFHRGEYEHWLADYETAGRPASGMEATFGLNCLPVVEAGQALLVGDDFAICDEVRLLPAPGHTPHHCCVEVRSRGQRALLVGDLLHHELQVRRPDWSTRFCWDPAMAARSRRGCLEDLAASGAWMLPSHFPAPTAVRIRAGDGEGFRLDLRGE